MVPKEEGESDKATKGLQDGEALSTPGLLCGSGRLNHESESTGSFQTYLEVKGVFRR